MSTYISDQLTKFRKQINLLKYMLSTTWQQLMIYHLEYYDSNNVNTGWFILILTGKYFEKYARYEKMFQTKVIWF